MRAAAVVEDLLDPPERARLHDLPDADAAASAHALLRLLLRELTGTPPVTHVLTRRCRECGGAHGRPTLPTAWVSVARTPVLVAAAATSAGHVGIDVELARRTAFDGFDQVVLAPGEADGPPEVRARTWARKEAALKADGRGLDVDLRAFSAMTPPPGTHLLDVPAPPGAACAVAVRAPLLPELELLDGERLLTPAGRAGA